jgi:hypothetical protein
MANQQAELESAKQNAILQQQTNLANQAAEQQQMLSKAQLGLQAVQQLAAAGSGEINAAAQQAGLQQSAANTAGNLSAQTANLANIYGNLGTQQANIYNQQAATGGQLAQGIGTLATQQFGIGRDIGLGLCSLGTQQGNIGAQQGNLAQSAQSLAQQDANFLYNLGTSQQKQLQAELDAERQNTLQQNMQPYQQVAFLSDIYKGAPSSQMSSMQQLQATPSPFQQAAGLAIAGTSAAKAAGVI